MTTKYECDLCGELLTDINRMKIAKTDGNTESQDICDKCLASMKAFAISMVKEPSPLRYAVLHQKIGTSEKFSSTNNPIVQTETLYLTGDAISELMQNLVNGVKQE